MPPLCYFRELSRGRVLQPESEQLDYNTSYGRITPCLSIDAIIVFSASVALGMST